MTTPVPTEAYEHNMLVAYLTVRRLKFTHVANETGGGRYGKLTAIRNKRNGVSAGFPDFLIIVGDQVITIELKRQKGSKVSPEQEAWVQALNDAGVASRICFGFDQSVKFIEMVEGLQRGRAA